MPGLLRPAVTLSQNLYRSSPAPRHDAGGSSIRRVPAAALGRLTESFVELFTYRKIRVRGRPL